MSYYDRIDVFEGIYVNKTTESKECDICHYWHILNKGFKFPPNVCNRFHDLLMMSMNLSDVAILNNKATNTCLAVISLGSALNKNGNYYAQVFLKECKYVKKKVVQHIIDDLESLLMLLIIMMILMKNKLKL